MATFKLDSLADLDTYVLDVLTMKLVARAHKQQQHVIQRKVWYSYLDAIARFRDGGEARLELPALSAADCLEIAMIAAIEAGNADEASFWAEVAEHMKAANSMSNEHIRRGRHAGQ